MIMQKAHLSWAPALLVAVFVAVPSPVSADSVPALQVMARAASPAVPKPATAAPDGAIDERAAAAAVASSAAIATAPRPCSAPTELTRLAQPLTHTARVFAGGLPIKIVAIGSSSTAGAGASSEAASYPSRLAVELAERFPDQQFTVINRGVNGEEAKEMIARLESGVIAEKPDLVLWQVGTNAVLRNHPLSPTSSLIEQGVARLKATGADVILIDPQFAPKVIAKADAPKMVELLAAKAHQYRVNLFRRFAVMRHWHQSQGIAFDTFVSPDQLHMNDWSYACVAKVLSAAIGEAMTRPTASASAGRTR